MKRVRGRVICLKIAETSGIGINDGSRINIDRIKTIIMLKAIIMCLNFKGNAPIIDLSTNPLYVRNHKLKPGLRQRCESFTEAE